MLTIDGDLYTMGCGEQGQLGRVAEIHAIRGGRKGPGRCYGTCVEVFGTFMKTMGCGEQGQMGFVAEIHDIRDGCTGPGRCYSTCVKVFGTFKYIL